MASNRSLQNGLRAKVYKATIQYSNEYKHLKEENLHKNTIKQIKGKIYVSMQKDANTRLIV